MPPPAPSCQGSRNVAARPVTHPAGCRGAQKGIGSLLMGASVRVEDAVFGDPRFERLGLLCGLSLADAEAWSIGVMAKIWRQCTSKMSYSLSPSSLNAIARK